MQKLEKLIDSPSNWLIAVAGVSTMIMMLHVTTDIVTKFLFNYQIEGTIEFVASYNMVIIVFLPLAYVAAHEGHIIVELFTRSLPRPTLGKLDGAMGIITFLFMILFTWLTAEEAIVRTIEGEVELTGDDVLMIWPSRWLLPIGCGVMAAYVLVRLVKDFRGTGDQTRSADGPV